MEEDFNHTFGVDGRWGIGEYGLIQGFVAKTETPGADEQRARVPSRWELRLRQVVVFGRLHRSGERFQPRGGFPGPPGVPQTLGVHSAQDPPRKVGALLEIRPHASYRGFWDFDGFQETGFFHLDNPTGNGGSSYELHTGVNFTREGVKEPFEIYPGIKLVSGDIRQRGSTNWSRSRTRERRPAFEVRTFVGGFFGGDAD